MRCVSERHAEDLQHLISAPIQSHVMLNNGNEAVGTDGSIDLNSYGIFYGILESSPFALRYSVTSYILNDSKSHGIFVDSNGLLS